MSHPAVVLPFSSGKIASFPMFELNTLREYGAALSDRDSAHFSPAAANELHHLLGLCPMYRPTPLRHLPELAQQLGISSLDVKDESSRLGLGSFKALGGAYAVVRIVLQAASSSGATAPAENLLDPAMRKVAKSITVTCATDGNHGLSVAAGARLTGCRARIFVHEGVSSTRVAAIERLGAEVVRISGTYDDAVDQCRQEATRLGHVLVADTSWPGYEQIPGLVMQGYTAIAKEVLEELTESPTHVFLQAGVGGLAASISAYMNIALKSHPPKIIVVEPDRAACLFASLQSGVRKRIDDGLPTAMAMLECYEPSELAWRILARQATAFMTVGDEDAAHAAELLMRGSGLSPSMASTESGAAGLAGLCAVAASAKWREKIDLNAGSRVLVINTEGNALAA